MGVGAIAARRSEPGVCAVPRIVLRHVSILMTIGNLACHPILVLLRSRVL
jgi:hypothetical protein